MLAEYANTSDIQSVHKSRKSVVIPYYPCEKYVKNLTSVPHNLQVRKS
jgi:hypothetical protein